MFYNADAGLIEYEMKLCKNLMRFAFNKLLILSSSFFLASNRLCGKDYRIPKQVILKGNSSSEVCIVCIHRVHFCKEESLMPQF